MAFLNNIIYNEPNLMRRLFMTCLINFRNPKEFKAASDDLCEAWSNRDGGYFWHGLVLPKHGTGEVVYRFSNAEDSKRLSFVILGGVYGETQGITKQWPSATADFTQATTAELLQLASVADAQ
jgi:hypothetical protein